MRLPNVSLRVFRAGVLPAIALVTIGVATVPALAQRLEPARRASTQVREPDAPLAATLRPSKPKTPVEVTPKLVSDAVSEGAAMLLKMQETFEAPGTPKAEWPYQGVYRVGGRIPIGYRVGGTAICATALTRSPGLENDAPRREAIERACAFVCAQTSHPLMSVDDYDAGYDVRGWGYTFGLDFLLTLERAKLVPEKQQDAVSKAIAFYIDALERTAIPEAGGWNYARPPGKAETAPPSSFMTACTLMTLYDARDAGHVVKDEVVERAIKFLLTSRDRGPKAGVDGKATSVLYAGSSRVGRDNSAELPGATGRMCVTEAALFLAGKSGEAELRGAVDAFIEHWDALDVRRMQSGTHIPPYGVAPYYFMFAHRYAAMCVEMLPEPARAERREKINALMFGVRSSDGTWNDRVFPRSANYGTAMAVLSMTQPQAKLPAKWKAAKDDGGKK